MISRAMRHLLFAAVLPAALQAQVPADSIPAWTAWLAAGPTAERMHAAGKLAAIDHPLPASTQQAVVHELDRVHALMLDGAPVPDEIEAGFENFGEYYLNLVIMAAGFRSPDSDRALVPAVGVSRGVQKRVARLGDAAVPGLVRVIRTDHDPAAALGALGLAWFWADSTRAGLSAESRQTIVSEILAAAYHHDPTHRLGAMVALEETRDASWLPLLPTLDTELTGSGGAALGWLRAYAAPALLASADRAAPEALLHGSRRMLEALCADHAAGERRALCEVLLREFDAAAAHLAASRTGPALNVLEAIVRRADQALARSVIAGHEHALIAGGAKQVAERLSD
jgi:hypothetical protein